MAKWMVCTQCESVGKPKTRTKGSFFIEVVLWLAFIVPGIIYSLWRLTTKEKVCVACGAAALVPVGSPAGQRITGGVAP